MRLHDSVMDSHHPNCHHKQDLCVKQMPPVFPNKNKNIFTKTLVTNIQNNVDTNRIQSNFCNLFVKKNRSALL